MPDDWGWDLWHHGSAEEVDDPTYFGDQTNMRYGLNQIIPNVMQYFVREGVRLDHVHTAVTCSPSRRSLMTGRFTTHETVLNDGNRTITPVPMPSPGRYQYRYHVLHWQAAIRPRGKCACCRR